jgi:hypothetical protein
MAIKNKLIVKKMNFIESYRLELEIKIEFDLEINQDFKFKQDPIDQQKSTVNYLQDEQSLGYFKIN